MLSSTRRPKVLSEIIEQDHVVKQLKNRSKNLDFPTYILFHGHSGTGKTSCAFIIAKLLNCKKPVKNEFGYYDPCNECGSCNSVNSMKFGRDIYYRDGSQMGIREIRELSRKLNSYPMYDSNKIFIIDESHLLAQDRTKGALLTMFERPRKNVYFILCTTKFDEFDLAFSSRFARYPFYPISYDAIHSNIRDVLTTLSVKIPEEYENEFIRDVMPMIASSSQGSVRRCLEDLDVCLSGEFWTRSDVMKALSIEKG